MQLITEGDYRDYRIAVIESKKKYMIAAIEFRQRLLERRGVIRSEMSKKKRLHILPEDPERHEFRV